jgi:hypothetical protein
MRKEAKAPDPVVEAHEHDALFGEFGTGIHAGRRTAIDETAAINPDHDRQLAGCRMLGPPDIHKEAVLAEPDTQRRSVTRKRLLDAVLSIRACITHPLPGVDRLRGTPAQRAQGRLRIGDAFEGLHAVVDMAGDTAGFGGHDLIACLCAHRRGEQQRGHCTGEQPVDFHGLSLCLVLHRLASIRVCPHPGSARLIL